MKPVPHGEPYAGKLHVRFDEGAGVPHGASRSTLHPLSYSTMNVARRTCGYIGSQFWNQGRTHEIRDRVMRLD